jgi:hypothetical protein
MLMTASEDSLQKLICHLSKAVSAYNLTISTAKTKILALKGKESIRAKIVINNNIKEQVADFNDIGCRLGSNRNRDLQNKLQRFNYLCGTIKRTLLNRSQQQAILKFYKVLAVPAVLYGSGCWTLTRQQIQQIKSSEKRFLRSVAGYRRTDEKRDTDIRQNLKIFNLGQKIRECQQNYFENILRMSTYQYSTTTVKEEEIQVDHR